MLKHRKGLMAIKESDQDRGKEEDKDQEFIHQVSHLT